MGVKLSTSLDTTSEYVAGNGVVYPKVAAECPPRLYALRIRNGNYAEIDEILHKRCPRCKDYWPADTEYFYAAPSQKDGLYPWCKACYQEWRYPSGRSKKTPIRINDKEKNE